VEGAEEHKRTSSSFPESVNAPVMASMNLANIFLDPEVGRPFYERKDMLADEYL